MPEPLEIKLDNLPTTAGVYQFKDKAGKIIYVGKAKNLRNRVRSYFVNKPVGPRLAKMISLIKDLEIINTDSEVESLILEMNLIKQMKPRYNVNLKDDKSFPYIVVTNELFPRVFSTRKRWNNGSKYFGPFTDVTNMKYSLKMLRDIFMIRTCNLNITEEAIEKKKFKVCLEFHIHKCEGPCEGLVDASRYNEMIGEVEKLLNGKTTTLMYELQDKMNSAAENEKFEEAAMYRNRLESLSVYAQKQKVVSDDFKDKDIVNFVKEEDDACAMILNIRDGKVIGKRHYYLTSVEDKSAPEILESVVFRYYEENNFIPDELHFPEEFESEDVSMTAIEDWFAKKDGKTPHFIFPKRGEKVQLLAMVKTNARYMLDELKLQRLKREFIPNSVSALKRDLRLTKLPRRIECFDISNIQGTDTVASMVVFVDGRPKKNDYRKFKIRSAANEVGRPDDFASMREVIYRRYIKFAEKLASPNSSVEKDIIASPLTPLPKGEGNNGFGLPLSSQERGTGGEVTKPDTYYQTEKARALRKKGTPAEKKLWSRLRNNQIENCKFRRQHPIGYYIVDFFCYEKNLIIEVDGSIHGEEENKDYDARRQKELESIGYRVVRFSNDEVLNHIDNVLEKIKDIIASPLTPLPEGEGNEGVGLPLSSQESERINKIALPLSSQERGSGSEDINASLKTISGSEDTAESLPDLIVIDGGKGQLSSAYKVLTDIGIKNINIIGLAKKLEEVFVPEAHDPQSIPKTSSGLKLLQRVRDEAHRFAITFHRSLRDKRTLKSELEDIKGIGKTTAAKLLKEFGSVESIKEMIANNFEEFEKRAGAAVSKKLRGWAESKLTANY